MIRTPENQRVLDNKNGYLIIASGKNKRRLSLERRNEFNRFVEFLTKSFKQPVHAVYLNEHNTEEDKLYNIAFVFAREDKK